MNKYLKNFKQITEAEIYKNRTKPNIDQVSNDFWEMVTKLNWMGTNKTVDDYRLKLFTTYSKEEIIKFSKIYDNLYNQFYNYFEPVWLDEKYDRYMPSDDGYTDLISSIVGSGKSFVKSCVNSDEPFIKMAKTDKFKENFGYIFQGVEDEYDEIISKITNFKGNKELYKKLSRIFSDIELKNIFSKLDSEYGKGKWDIIRK